jgi:hypothetical protein
MKCPINDNEVEKKTDLINFQLENYDRTADQFENQSVSTPFLFVVGQNLV